jgi:hypothetical protein
MIEEWVRGIEAAGRAALDQVGDLPATPRELEAVVVVVPLGRAAELAEEASPGGAGRDR